MEKIGVVIPTYNRKELLVRALKSLQVQSYSNWVAVVVDDCSDEDVLGYLKESKALEDKRIIYIRLDKNSGVNKARNRALDILNKEQSVDWIAFLDDDDYYVDNYFNEAIGLIKESSCQWLLMRCVDEDNLDVTKISQEGYVDYLDYFTGDKISGDAAMMVSAKLTENVRFTEDIKNGYEWYYFLHLSRKANPYVSSEIGKVVCYQENGLTKSKIKRNKNKKSFQKLAFREFGFSYNCFLAKKHSVVCRDGGKLSSCIKKIFYTIVCKIS